MKLKLLIVMQETELRKVLCIFKIALYSCQVDYFAVSLIRCYEFQSRESQFNYYFVNKEIYVYTSNIINAKVCVCMNVYYHVSL